jgi:hypothetical protein
MANAPSARRPLVSVFAPVGIRPAVVWTRCVGRVGVVRAYNLDIVLNSGEGIRHTCALAARAAHVPRRSPPSAPATPVGAQYTIS